MPEYPVLYSFRRCPYAIRARMALAAAGISCEIREVLLRDKPGEMLKLSSKGTVPVLQLADGRVIDESLEVMYWALRQSDPEHWLSLDADESHLLIERNDYEFKDYLDRYKYFVRYPEFTQEFYRQQAEDFLQELEKRLDINNGAGLAGNKLSLPDIAIFPFVRQFSRVDPGWFTNSPFVRIRGWLENLEYSNLFQRVMKKYERWTFSSNIEMFP